MDLQLSGLAAVVVGGAAGIGRAIAEAMAAEGADTAVVDISPKTPDVAAEIEQQHQVKTLGIVADITDFSAMQKAAEQVFSTWGRCDHLVISAGAGSGKFGFPFWNLQPDDWNRVLQINLIGSVNVAHAFAPSLIKSEAGSMLFLASVAGQIGSQSDPPYSAAKAAIINFAQCAAKDLAPYNVRVNALSPGMVKTSLNQDVWRSWNDLQSDENKQSYDDWAAEKIGKLCPLAHWQEPEDMAAMAVFLASPKAKNITGQTLNIDGGWVMHS